MESLVAPGVDSVHLVNEWLASHGLLEDSLSRSPGQDWVMVKVPVSLAEEMLKTVRAQAPEFLCGTRLRVDV